MLYIEYTKEGKYGVRDTSDNILEEVNIDTLRLAFNKGVHIEGMESDCIYPVFPYAKGKKFTYLGDYELVDEYKIGYLVVVSHDLSRADLTKLQAKYIYWATVDGKVKPRVLDCTVKRMIMRNVYEIIPDGLDKGYAVAARVLSVCRNKNRHYAHECVYLPFQLLRLSTTAIHEIQAEINRFKTLYPKYFEKVEVLYNDDVVFSLKEYGHKLARYDITTHSRNVIKELGYRCEQVIVDSVLNKMVEFLRNNKGWGIFELKQEYPEENLKKDYPDVYIIMKLLEGIAIPYYGLIEGYGGFVGLEMVNNTAYAHLAEPVTTQTDVLNVKMHKLRLWDILQNEIPDNMFPIIPHTRYADDKFGTVYIFETPMGTFKIYKDIFKRVHGFGADTEMQKKMTKMRLTGKGDYEMSANGELLSSKQNANGVITIPEGVTHLGGSSITITPSTKGIIFPSTVKTFSLGCFDTESYHINIDNLFFCNRSNNPQFFKKFLSSMLETKFEVTTAGFYQFNADFFRLRNCNLATTMYAIMSKENVLACVGNRINSGDISVDDMLNGVDKERLTEVLVKIMPNVLKTPKLDAKCMDVSMQMLRATIGKSNYDIRLPEQVTSMTMRHTPVYYEFQLCSNIKYLCDKLTENVSGEAKKQLDDLLLQKRNQFSKYLVEYIETSLMQYYDSNARLDRLAVLRYVKQKKK